MKHRKLQLAPIIVILSLIAVITTPCEICYSQRDDKNCPADPFPNITSHTLHMAVHPHLDAFWIFDFESYYNPNPNQQNVMGYFASNRFNSVKQIFDTTLQVLKRSKDVREREGPARQEAHRTFFNSQMGFFKRWYYEQSPQNKKIVKDLLKTKYWQIVGGGFVQHDEGCAYYDDIIQNFQVGLRFLKEQFSYYPRAAISADSFGHSQSTLAILAHLGVQGFFVQRSDEHILLQNKTQFVWKAKSANGQYYGALPTHIRWAIHGFQDQFIGGGNNQQAFCQTKAPYVSNMNRENQFLKRILHSSHIMRYFGHDFQKFDDYSYRVIQGFMEKFSMQKCNKVTAVYGNPSQYFKILMGQVFNKVKPLATRQQDIMPIWDYDSGLYWTGYYTTDQFHKKNYRDAGRYLYAARKLFTPLYISEPNSDNHKNSYRLLQEFSQTVAYLQHHDGISGTSKYQVMDKYQILSDRQIDQIKKQVFQQMFQVSFPLNTNTPAFDCSLQRQCTLPEMAQNDIYLKIFKTGASCIETEPIIVHLNQNQYFQPQNCTYEINCFCTALPCRCDLYLYPKIGTYGLLRLKKVDYQSKQPNLLHLLQRQNLQADQSQLKYNNTHITIIYNSKQYNIGYKRLNGDPTPRNYDHLSRYGQQTPRGFQIRSGKYALGSNIKTQANLSNIKKVLKLESDSLKKYIILWGRDHMKTIITIPKSKPNQWKIETLSSAESGKLQDLYLQIQAPHIDNKKKFYTDSNGWLVMKRQLFYHEDYKAFFSPEGFDDINGNSYPMTAFVYIQDGKSKVSVNTDRPQGVIAYKSGTIWINYDRLSSDDGKWVYENTFRSQYQKFVHYVTVQNKDNNERKIQKMYDEPLIIQGNFVGSSERISTQSYRYTKQRQQWQTKTNINNIKFSVKPWNDSSLTVRVQNLNETQTVNFHLFSTADKISTFLTAYYGNVISYQKVYETNLGGNVEYQTFLKKKWNWNRNINLQKQNQIFNKIFGQSMPLRPLQIRTFVFEGIKMNTEQCKELNQIKYSSSSKSFKLDITKPAPLRSDLDKLNQERVKNYLLNQDHCNVKSPIQKVQTSIQPQKVQPIADFSTLKDQSSSQVSFDIQTHNQIIQPQKPNIRPTEKSKQSEKPKEKNQQQQKIQQQKQKTQKPTQKQQKQHDFKGQDLPQDFESIKAKIKAREVLTRDQKQKYFEKLSKILRKELKISSS